MILPNPIDLSLDARQGLTYLIHLLQFEAAKLWLEGAGFTDDDAKECGWWYPNYVRVLKQAIRQREADLLEDECIIWSQNQNIQRAQAHPQLSFTHNGVDYGNTSSHGALEDARDTFDDVKTEDIADHSEAQLDGTNPTLQASAASYFQEMQQQIEAHRQAASLSQL